MFADGVRPGLKDPVDGVVGVLFFLLVHGPVLAAGVVGILGSHAIAVFGLVTVRGQKIFEATFAQAGGMAPVHPVEQVVHIEVHIAREEHPVDENHLLFILGVSRECVGRTQTGIRIERLYRGNKHFF